VYNSYGSGTENFKCEVFQCAEEKGSHKATAIFGVEEINV
jgi:hypothetical protein